MAILLFVDTEDKLLVQAYVKTFRLDSVREILINNFDLKEDNVKLLFEKQIINLEIMCKLKPSLSNYAKAEIVLDSISEEWALSKCQNFLQFLSKTHQPKIDVRQELRKHLPKRTEICPRNNFHLGGKANYFNLQGVHDLKKVSYNQSINFIRTCCNKLYENVSVLY